MGYIGTVAALSWAFGSDPIFNVLAGGVLLGAFFMATDYVSSPMTKNGKLVFGIGCGVFNAVGRFFGPISGVHHVRDPLHERPGAAHRQDVHATDLRVGEAR